jgi:hypothetical protein
MAGIYGPIIEHPELSETDAGRFTVTIYRHRFAEDASDRERHTPEALRRCWRCGYGREHPVHAAPFEATE